MSKTLRSMEEFQWCEILEYLEAARDEAQNVMMHDEDDQQAKDEYEELEALVEDFKRA